MEFGRAGDRVDAVAVARGDRRVDRHHQAAVFVPSPQPQSLDSCDAAMGRDILLRPYDLASVHDPSRLLLASWPGISALGVLGRKMRHVNRTHPENAGDLVVGLHQGRDHAVDHKLHRLGSDRLDRVPGGLDPVAHRLKGLHDVVLEAGKGGHDGVLEPVDDGLDDVVLDPVPSRTNTVAQGVEDADHTVTEGGEIRDDHTDKPVNDGLDDIVLNPLECVVDAVPHPGESVRNRGHDGLEDRVGRILEPVDDRRDGGLDTVPNRLDHRMPQPVEDRREHRFKDGLPDLEDHNDRGNGDSDSGLDSVPDRLKHRMPQPTERGRDPVPDGLEGRHKRARKPISDRRGCGLNTLPCALKGGH